MASVGSLLAESINRLLDGTCSNGVERTLSIERKLKQAGHATEQAEAELEAAVSVAGKQVAWLTSRSGAAVPFRMKQKPMASRASPRAREREAAINVAGWASALPRDPTEASRSHKPTDDAARPTGGPESLSQ